MSLILNDLSIQNAWAHRCWWKVSERHIEFEHLAICSQVFEVKDYDDSNL